MSGIFTGPPTTSNGRGRRGEKEKRSGYRFYRVDKARRNAILLDLIPTPDINGNANAKKSDKKQLTRKKCWNRKMIIRKKLVFIYKYYEHINKYWHSNKTKF